MRVVQQMMYQASSESVAAVQLPLLQANSRVLNDRVALPEEHENLPHQWSECLGREKEKERLLKCLHSRSSLISLEGLGGVGKTTLAIEVARSCLRGPQAVLDPPFEYVVWVSAKDQPEQKHWLIYSIEISM